MIFKKTSSQVGHKRGNSNIKEKIKTVKSIKNCSKVQGNPRIQRNMKILKKCGPQDAHSYCLFHMTAKQTKTAQFEAAVKLLYLSQFSMDWLGIFYA